MSSLECLAIHLGHLPTLPILLLHFPLVLLHKTVHQHHNHRDLCCAPHPSLHHLLHPLQTGRAPCLPQEYWAPLGLGKAHLTTILQKLKLHALIHVQNVVFPLQKGVVFHHQNLEEVITTLRKSSSETPLSQIHQAGVRLATHPRAIIAKHHISITGSDLVLQIHLLLNKANLNSVLKIKTGSGVHVMGKAAERTAPTTVVHTVATVVIAVATVGEGTTTSVAAVGGIVGHRGETIITMGTTIGRVRR